VWRKVWRRLRRKQLFAWKEGIGVQGALSRSKGDSVEQLIVGSWPNECGN
jgi:hypothetical protein